MSDLTKAYSNYYSEPTKDNADELVDTVKKYDFSTYTQDVEDLKKLMDEVSENDAVFHSLELIPKTEISNGTAFMLTSNGSLSVNNSKYPFGPNTEYVKNKIENHLRSDKGEKVVDLTSQMVENIKDLYEKTGPVRVMGTSSELLYPTTNYELSDWLYQNRHMISSVTNMNWEPFYKKSFIKDGHFNDQMIDWKTGVNFYTCEHGHKHTLPLWVEKDGKHINLLNMNFLNADISDMMNIKGFSKCECGKSKCEFDFLPHYQRAIKNEDGKVFYNVDLVEELSGCYHRLQFLQNPETNKVSIYSMPNGKVNKDDLDYIVSQLEVAGLEHELVNGKWFLVGRAKAPNFWRGDKNNIKEFTTVKPIMFL